MGGLMTYLMTRNLRSGDPGSFWATRGKKNWHERSSWGKRQLIKPNGLFGAMTSKRGMKPNGLFSMANNKRYVGPNHLYFGARKRYVEQPSLSGLEETDFPWILRYTRPEEEEAGKEAETQQ